MALSGVRYGVLVDYGLPDLTKNRASNNDAVHGSPADAVLAEVIPYVPDKPPRQVEMVGVRPGLG